MIKPKLKVEDRTSDYICRDCGKEYLVGESNNVHTHHVNKCGICGEEKSVTHMRAYNYIRKQK